MTSPDLAARPDQIVAELAAAGVRPSPLAIIAHAVGNGLDEETTVALAALVREQQHEQGARSEEALL
jgi:hypothetical protein